MLALFYVDDSVLASIDAARLQSSQDILVSLFKRVDLDANKHSVSHLCQGRSGRLSNRSYTQQQEGVMRPTKWQCHQVECDVCGDTMQQQFLYCHLENKHNVFWSRVIGQHLLIEHEEETFEVWKSLEDNQFH